MSGSSRGGKLYGLMASGQTVPNEIVNDIIAEAMVRTAGGADVILYMYTYLQKKYTIKPAKF